MLVTVVCRFGYCGSVVHAASGERFNARHIQGSDGYAGGDQQCVAAQLSAIAQDDKAVRVFHSHLCHLLRGQDLHTEALCLGGGPPGEICAAQAPGKAQIILYERAGTRLAPGGLLLDHGDVQSFGPAVDGGSQARRTTAHDDQVVEGLRRLRLQAHLLGQRPVIRLHQHTTVGEEQHWQTVLALIDCLNQLSGLRLLLDIQPPVGDPVASQELFDVVAGGRPEGACHPDAIVRHRHGGGPVA